MKLQSLLSQKGIVLQTPNTEDVLTRAKESSPIKLFYGETYDHTGNTIDSMKYYFFVANLAQSLIQEGFKVNPTILVADSAACRNVSAELEYKYKKLGEARADFVLAVNEVYKTNLNVLKMSDYLNTEAFQTELKKVMNICKSDSELMDKVEKSVPESKQEIERKKGFMYSFDEITTIMNLDVKIGPPREDLYDNIARQIAKIENSRELMSLFLTPTFPLGKKWDYFFSNEGIEHHGITAYKGGSKRLQDYRILVGRTLPEYAEELINSSFISTNPELPNPVLDTGLICEMARKRLEEDDSPVTLAQEFYSGNIDPNQLKERVSKSLETNVLSKF